MGCNHQSDVLYSQQTFYQSLSPDFFTQPAPVQSWGLDATVRPLISTLRSFNWEAFKTGLRLQLSFYVLKV